MFSKLTRGIAAVMVGALALIGSAHAELPPAVPTAITGASTDGGTLIGLVVAGFGALYLIHKLLKKFGIL